MQYIQFIIIVTTIIMEYTTYGLQSNTIRIDPSNETISKENCPNLNGEF